jgi:transcriptional regulator with XRE-family HTH domain
MSKVHIGQKIKSVSKKAGYTVEQFGQLINITRDGANKIFKKDYLDTELLRQISKALNHDFFIYFSEELDISHEPSNEYGYPSREDFSKMLQLLEKVNQRIDSLEKRLVDSKSKKVAGKSKKSNR